MKEIRFSYIPLTFEGPETREKRITKDHIIRKMTAEQTEKFLAVSVIDPFVAKIIDSDLEELVTPLGTIKVQHDSEKPSTSWKEVYDRTLNYLQLGEAATNGISSLTHTKYIKPLGTGIVIHHFLEQLARFQDNATTLKTSSKVFWPKKQKGKPYDSEILIPHRSYRTISKENAKHAIISNQFSDGLEERVLTPFDTEVKRWFEANTRYNPPKKIPSKKDSTVERTLEIEPGSYIHIQLTRVQTPKYADSIRLLKEELLAAASGKKSKLRTQPHKSSLYASVKSIKSLLSQKFMAQNDLLHIYGRYTIVP